LSVSPMSMVSGVWCWYAKQVQYQGFWCSWGESCWIWDQWGTACFELYLVLFVVVFSCCLTIVYTTSMWLSLSLVLL
jgi:hypothetical protein